jgi:hypothetical protein
LVLVLLSVAEGSLEVSVVARNTFPINMHETRTTTNYQAQVQLQLTTTNYYYYCYYHTNDTTLQLQLTTTNPQHYNYNYNCNYSYNYNCATPHYIQQLRVRWPLQPPQPLQKAQLQPPFGHQWFRSAIHA